MRVTLVTAGTQGDVQPYVALAMKLREFGHTVRFGCNSSGEKLVRECGLDFFCVSSDPNADLLWDESSDTFESGRSARHLASTISRQYAGRSTRYETRV